MVHQIKKTQWEVYSLEIETKLSELPNFLGNQQVYDKLLKENPSVKIFLNLVKDSYAEELDDPADRWVVIMYENTGILACIEGSISISVNAFVFVDESVLTVSNFSGLSDEWRMAFASTDTNPMHESYNSVLEAMGSNLVELRFSSDNDAFRNTVVTMALGILEKEGGELC